MSEEGRCPSVACESERDGEGEMFEPFSFRIFSRQDTHFQTKLGMVYPCPIASG
jgi:hypothetical protein